MRKEKMKKFKSLLIVCLCAGVALSTTGCGKKKKGGLRDGDIGGLTGTDIYGNPLGARPGEDMEYARQFEPVYFAYDSSQVDASERGKIEGVAESLRRSANTGVIVEGHCDERGSREYNMALGERRALAVRAYLIGLGIDGSRIQTKSFGEESPSAPGHDEESWRLNRRAEFVLFY
jgi:peptidoglycan-associated lipoprotein